jgi:hypothetical protein
LDRWFPVDGVHLQGRRRQEQFCCKFVCRLVIAK